MSDKRYQIFLSSTFSDLEDERKLIMQSLLEMNCIPSGMEFFPASDEETFEFIKSIISKSDYYILIVAGRYGSEAGDGLSFTEKEYQYAIDTGIPVLSFIRKTIDDLPAAKTDLNDKKREKLNNFRSRVLNSGKLVRQWSNGHELAGQVATTMMSSIQRHPAVGWIRGDQIPSTDILNDLIKTTRERDELAKLVKVDLVLPDSDSLVKLSDIVEVKYRYKKDRILFAGSTDGFGSNKKEFQLKEILSIVGHNYRYLNDVSGMSPLCDYINSSEKNISTKISFEQYIKLLVQLEILNLLSSKSSIGRVEFKLTEKGLFEYLSASALRKQ